MIRRPGTILALLTALNLFNYIDRFVLSAVLPRIESEFVLEHSVAGLLGTVFLLGYFATSPLFGTLADRGRRKGLIAIGVAVWSAATFASGMATGIQSLLVARVFVGVGEASYATIAPTIIDDIAPSDRKGRWLAIFYAASPIGSALGYIIGGQVEKAHGWRAAFYVAGGPGLLLAVLCLLMVEPPRNLLEKSVGASGRRLAEIWKTIRPLFKTPFYRKGVFGYCAYTFAIGGFAFWGPTFVFNRYAVPLDAASRNFGTITVLAGALGTALGGFWGDRAARQAKATDKALDARDSIRGYLRVCAIGSAVGAPLAVAAFLSPTPRAFFAFLFLCETAVFLSTSPINAVILHSVAPEIRASAMALSIFAIHLLGDLWSPPGVGLLADHLPIQWAMMALPVAIAVSALVWWPRGRAATRGIVS